MERYICIHCHFYQPPRENAWLEDVEYQESAAPYHDWNERINAQCYRANALSRILDDQGWVRELDNNYSRISFNMGPTLISWIEDKDPETYQAILDADKASQERFGGHGSAIAQAYNHMILPLANRRDKETQIIWGLKDFEKRFKRQPEAMWLPETAVDTDSLEILADLGMKYVILAPRQAKAVRSLQTDGPWQSVDGDRVDPKQPYLVRLPSGKSIAAFFYDGNTSQAVAFENLLDNGEVFAKRLTQDFDPKAGASQLVHIATDGETYGHHHRFGDMALAYALHYIEEQNLAKITIYGEYLAKYPPTMEAQVVENSSWSCFHGVERWRSDCGDNTGMHRGWNQQWRGPLRKAYDYLRDELEKPYEELAQRYCDDPWGLRNDYISVILNRDADNLDAFVAKWNKNAATVGRVEVLLKALELQRHLLLMYTSCAWFFDEISGIEGVQTMQYAYRVMQLAEMIFGKSLEDEFMAILATAPSNIPEIGDGKTAFLKYVVPQKVDFLKIAAHFAVSSLFEDYKKSNRIYSYRFEVFDYQRFSSGRVKMACGQVEIASIITLETKRMNFGVVHFGDQNINAGVRFFQSDDRYKQFVDEAKGSIDRADFPEVIRVFDRYFETVLFSLKDLLKDEQMKVTSLVLEKPLTEVEEQFSQVYERLYPTMRYFSNLQTKMPRVFLSIADFVQNDALKNALQNPSSDPDAVRKLVHEGLSWGIKPNEEELSHAFETAMNARMREYECSTNNEPILKEILQLLEQIKDLPFTIDLGPTQNRFYKWCASKNTIDTTSPQGKLYKAISEELKVRM